MEMERIISIIKKVAGKNTEYILPKLEWAIDYCKRHEEDEYIVDDLKRKAKMYKDALTPATAKVGDGVTVCLWSDRHAATIIKVTKSSVTVQYDKATLSSDFKPEFDGFYCTNNNAQQWDYERDENGRTETFRWSKKWASYGTPNNPRLIAGRHERYDYNF